MAIDIVPGAFWRGTSLPSFWDDEDWNLPTNQPGGLTISEDEKRVYVEAAVPGVDPKNVEITFDKGVVWIKGEIKEVEEKKKYYRKATSSFSYRVAVPGDIDLKVEPEATMKNGIMTVAFTKSAVAQPKKIQVKGS